MAQSKTQKIIKDTQGNEVALLRVDKTLRELTEEKPSSRWDVEYWMPKYDRLFAELYASKFKIVKLEDLMLEGINGITYGQVGQRLYDKNGEVQYLQVSNVRRTGIDIHAKYARIKAGTHNDPSRSRLKVLDLLIINGGVGSLGRTCLLLDESLEYNISQDIDRIRLKLPNKSFFVAVYLNSQFGLEQIERFTKGVSGQTKIGFDHVYYIRIPELPNSILDHIETEYKKMSEFHDKAMKAKKSGNEAEYKKHIAKTEQMLKDLVARTEAVIRGEREDVI